MEDIELIREFLIESHENLSRLDQEIIDLEKHPDNAGLLASVFRTIHTIKGTSGFFNFSAIEQITHQAETILSDAREGKNVLTPGVITLILEAVDAVSGELKSIESTNAESGTDWSDLIRRLDSAIARTGANIDDSVKEQTGRSERSPASPEEPVDCARDGALADSSVRVDVGLLNKLMNLVGELVLARNQILRFNAGQADPALNATSQRLDLITTELQEGVMKTRMQPIGIIWNKFPRIVRDLAKASGKQIQIEMEGGLTELDKTIVEAIRDPLTHLVRNACDHGIETPAARLERGKPATGKIIFRAFHEGGNVIIEVTDDGSGINIEQVRSAAIRSGRLRADAADSLTAREVMNLIFAPGLSTATKVTSISGRGVGMDVVKTNVEKIGGSVDLESAPGQGSTFRIRIPLTLAIIPGLVVSSGRERFVIPQASLLELIRLEGERGHSQIAFVHDAPVFRRRGGLLPLAWLNQMLDLGPAETAADAINIVILQVDDRQFGLVVDTISDTQEIVVKPLGNQLKALRCYAGATIMGDGKVSLILDTSGIAHLAGIDLGGGNSNSQSITASANGSDSDAAAISRKLLLFRAGSIDRLAVPLSLVARLEEIPAAKIERAGGGGLVLQYRGQIIPLAHASDCLEPGAEPAPIPDPAPVIVFAERERRIGLIVDGILDIVEEIVTVTRASGRSGLLGSAVVGGKVTDFVDVHAIIATSDRQWFKPSTVAGSTVLIADQSSFTRDVLRGSLEIAGHRVIDAGDPAEAIERLRSGGVNVVAAALDLPERGAFTLKESIQAQDAFPRVPVIALSGRPDIDRQSPEIAGFADCVDKFDREEMLRSLDRLARAIENGGSAEPAPHRRNEETTVHA